MSKFPPAKVKSNKTKLKTELLRRKFTSAAMAISGQRARFQNCIFNYLIKCKMYKTIAFWAIWVKSSLPAPVLSKYQATIFDCRSFWNKPIFALECSNQPKDTKKKDLRTSSRWSCRNWVISIVQVKLKTASWKDSRRNQQWTWTNGLWQSHCIFTEMNEKESYFPIACY